MRPSTMNDYQTVTDFLGSVREINKELEACQWQVKVLENRCRRSTIRPDLQPGPVRDTRREDPMIQLADLRTELDRLTEAHSKRTLAVDLFLGQLPDEPMRQLMHLRYVRGLRWPRVREEMQKLNLYYSERQVFYIHRKALDAAQAQWAEMKDTMEANTNV